ncbi:MAG: Tex-like N-terminal domain-containing protein, partial [Calditrichaceae bacterium]
MTELEMLNLLAEELNLKVVQVKNTVELLDAGNTVPFISRYRKEVTGSLDENQIRSIEERMNYLRTLEARKDAILKSIEEQGKLTPELKSKIEKAIKLQEVEDLYLPYKPKKRTRATVAREKGLEPLAELILKQEIMEGDPLEAASPYIDNEKEVESAEDALQGAMDIIA